MTETEAVMLFKCLSDKSRIQILKSLTMEDMYVERLSQRTGLTPGTVSFHMKKLSEAGAVMSYRNQYYTMYSLNRALFNTRMIDILTERTQETDVQDQRDEEYRQRVIRSFFEYGKLKSIPVQRKKKRIILEEIAQKFDYDVIYAEREVNLVIADIHDDFCTLRRDMISEGLMARDRNGYWRIREEA